MATPKNKKIKGTALYVRCQPKDCLDLAIEFCRAYELRLDVLNRMPDRPIQTLSHEAFLQKLEKTEYYLDLKGLTSRQILSVAGIEAVRRGCKVLTDTGAIVTDFPKTTFSMYLDLYKEVLQ